MYCGCSVIRKRFPEKNRLHTRWWNAKWCQQAPHWNQDLSFWAQWDPKARPQFPGWLSAPKNSKQNLLFRGYCCQTTSRQGFYSLCSGVKMKEEKAQMDLAAAGATIQLCLVDCWWLNLCRGSGALWDDMRQSRKSQINFFPSQILDKIHKGDINRSKNTALESETAGRKKFKRKRIKQLKD